MVSNLTFEDNILYGKLEGVLTLQSLLDLNSVYGDERFDDIQYVIIDFLDVIDHSLTVDDLKLKAASSNKGVEYNRNVKIFFVVNNQKILDALNIFLSIASEKSYWENTTVSSLDKAYELISSDNIQV